MQDSASGATLDWNLVRECYNKGMALKDLARQFNVKLGTIAARASRGNWKRTVTQANAIAQTVSVSVQAKSDESPEASAVTKASASVRAKLSDALLEATGCLDTLPKSKSLKSRSANAALLSTLAGVSKTVFGWSESSSQPAVRISIMGSAVAVSRDKPVIDVTPLKLNSESSASGDKPQ